MIAIEITAENKADNNLRESVGSVMTRGNYPNVWQGDRERVCLAVMLID